MIRNEEAPAFRLGAPMKQASHIPFADQHSMGFDARKITQRAEFSR